MQFKSLIMNEDCAVWDQRGGWRLQQDKGQWAFGQMEIVQCKQQRGRTVKVRVEAQ